MLEKPATTSKGMGLDELEGKEKITKSNRRGTLYELFILGELSAGPHHGYLLREILVKILGPFQKMSWGALYPLIHKLEEQGRITGEVEKVAKNTQRTSKREQRKIYRLTKTGRDTFQTLMNQTIPYKVYDPDLFIIKLNYFDYITAQEQVAILHYHQAYLKMQVDFIDTQLKQMLVNPYIPKEEKVRIQWVTEFRLKRLEAEAAWVAKALSTSRVKKGGT
jgi:DNA-binding PadR family transcriptional regulator